MARYAWKWVLFALTASPLMLSATIAKRHAQRTRASLSIREALSLSAVSRTMTR